MKLSDNAINPAYVTTPYLKLRAHDVTWSPDDSMLAYSARTDGNSNIWLVSANGSGNRAVSMNKDAKESYCCAIWAGAGTQLVFMSFGTTGSSKGQRIWIADTGAGVPRVVYESKLDFRVLGLADGGRDVVIVRKTDPTDVSSVVSADVYLVSMQTGQEQKVTTIQNSYVDNFHLAENGQTIAYVTRDKNVTELWTLPVTGSTPQKLVSENDPKDMISTLAWSQDGRAIVFGKQTRTNQISMLTN